MQTQSYSEQWFSVEWVSFGHPIWVPLGLFGSYKYLEATIRHAFDVERHLLRIAHRLKARIFHYTRVNSVPMFSRFEKHVGKHNRLTRFRLADFGKGNQALNF